MAAFCKTVLSGIRFAFGIVPQKKSLGVKSGEYEAHLHSPEVHPEGCIGTQHQQKFNSGDTFRSDEARLVPT